MADINTLGWPPYGHLSTDFRKQMEETDLPTDFRVNGQPATAADYTRYIDSEAKAMAEWLFPLYDQNARRWQGAASATAEALTIADLDLMAKLRAQLTEEAKCLKRGLGQTHQELFEAEDESAKPTLEIYLSIVKADLRRKVRAGVEDSLNRVGTTHLRLKVHFQRPRALQTAYLLGRAFDHEMAKTAYSPAMISGHCFQGLAGRVGGFLATRGLLNKVPEALESFQQYTVDIGDRRVFAGVHYPSDNISSWYTALRLCDHSFGKDGPDAKKFMWDAISQCSIVYRAIVDASNTPGSPYADLLARLKEEAKRPAKV